MLMGFTTSNIVAAIPVNESIARQNLGVQKRIASTAAPLLSVIGKGGSAFVAVLTMLTLFTETTESMPSASVIAITAITAATVSFASSVSAGTEIAIITVITLQLLGINLYGAENAIVAFLPILGGLATMIDSLIVSFGNSVVATAVGTDVEIPYRDTI